MPFPPKRTFRTALWAFRASASGESDIHGWYEKRVAEGTVPYEVVRPSVTLITRYSVIANGRLRYASRREQPVSLRRHYPHQVLGRSSSSSLSAFRLPFGCAFIFAQAPDKLAPVHVELVLM